MKNNQFRAHLTKYIYQCTELDPNTITRFKCLSVDIDSNTRKIYLYKWLDYTCVGSISLYSNRYCPAVAEIPQKSALKRVNKTPAK